jgi:hypothetical protein
MIDINKAAEVFADEATFRDGTQLYATYFQGVIAGHNSKATQAKVIQGQIDVLKPYFNNELYI